MTSLADRLEQRKNSPKRCVLGVLMAPDGGLDDEQREALVAYVTEKDARGGYVFGPTLVSDDLRDTTEYEISEGLVRKHRKAKCACHSGSVR